jgi:hypothetical protein
MGDLTAYHMHLNIMAVLVERERERERERESVGLRQSIPFIAVFNFI